MLKKMMFQILMGLIVLVVALALINCAPSTKFTEEGMNYIEKKQYAEAVRAFQQAIRLDGSGSTDVAYVGLGLAYAKAGNFNESIAVLKHAIDIEPNHAESYKGLGDGYYALSRYEEALEAYRHAIQLKPDLPGANYQLGRTYSEMGR